MLIKMCYAILLEYTALRSHPYLSEKAKSVEMENKGLCRFQFFVVILSFPRSGRLSSSNKHFVVLFLEAALETMLSTTTLANFS